MRERSTSTWRGNLVVGLVISVEVVACFVYSNFYEKDLLDG